MSTDEQREYENEVFYQVWRAGGNPDRINDDRVLDNFYDHEDEDYAAQIELNAQRQARQRHDDIYGGF